MWRRGLKKGLTIFLFCLLSVGISDGFGNYALKKTVQRLRPGDTVGLEVVNRSPYGGGFSFVSNHATNMFSFASFTSAIFPPATIPLYGLASIVAYSRVYNGVHYPADVICGGLLGMAFGLLFATLCLRLLSRLPQQGTKSA
ncbi:phosphatase PAP2 family protein [Bdellovibrio reynosensis]|uniref:Phosphatase PAP2 family protein n=1 Tax=Bdellovibrio reynosensis TaxID=2835041 RepID=A0ABY4C5X1_9BACT|nr:phosphatase PAP2 family protein [Bdellovibrio reynosensis]UOF00273.1 phosphatase PAP2 family protein [Bdellovibrio reynosensis]